MAGETLGEVLRRIGRRAGLEGVLSLTDAQLLERFAAGRDEPAFAALMARHGPVVLGLCRRLLPVAQDAEDAFQAAFLVLARKAAAIRRQALLGPWLYGVAWRVAVRLRGRTARRRERERAGVDLDALPADDAAWSDVGRAVQEEVRRLPDAYRSAVILCCLEGKSSEEAARLLRRPVGTVKSRLSRARELLRSRLTRRGMAVSAVALGTALAASTATASAALVDATVRAALPFAAGGAVAGGVVAARAAALSQGVLRTMMLKKITIAAAAVLALVLFAGVGGLAYRSWAAAPGDDPKAQTPAADKPKDEKPREDKEALPGVWRVESVEVAGKDATDKWAGTVREWVVTDAAIRFRNGVTDYSSPYKLDPDKRPKEIDVAPMWPAYTASRERGRPNQGVYSLDGDTWKVCFPRGTYLEGPPAEGRDRPKEVASKEADGTILITLKRVKTDVDKPKDDKEALLGVWRVVSVEVGGKQEAPEKGKEEEWVVKDGWIHVRPKDPKQVPIDEVFAVRPDANPKEIDINPYPVGAFFEGDVDKGIYTLDGDVWKVCLPHPPLDAIKADRPKVMAAKEGGETILITLKRVKPDQDKKDDRQAIQGVWRITRIVQGGKEQDDAQARYEKTERYVITADRVVIRYEIGVNTDKGPTTTGESEFTYDLDPKQSPKVLDLWPQYAPYKGKVMRGVYSLDGDVLTFCQDPVPDGERPKELASKEGDNARLLTLKRVPPDEDKEALQGVWRPTSIEREGKKAPADQLADIRVTFDGDKSVFDGGITGEVSKGTFVLDATKEPRTIDVKRGDDVLPGIYQLDAGTQTLTLALAVPGKRPAGKERPTGFASPAGSGVVLWVLERVPADRPKDK